jgi:cobalt-zinc-cadmium efflux system protein
MAHPDNHIHSHDRSTGNITIAFFLNLIFAVVELIGGFFTNSIAIMSDALHDFGDSFSLGVAWYLQKLSNRGRDRFYSYGYKRFSLLGAIFISVVLIVGSVFVIRESAVRLLSPEETNAKGMFLFAILGIAVNGFAVLRLRKGTSFNERSVSLHLLEDVLGWLAVLLVSIIMMFVDLPILDPILSIGISIWVLSNVYNNLKSTFKVLLQEIPQDVEIEKLKVALLNVKGIISLHDLHLWTLDGENHILTIHVVIEDNVIMQQQSLKIQIRKLCEQFKIEHVTIEFETGEESCGLDDC